MEYKSKFNLKGGHNMQIEKIKPLLFEQIKKAFHLTKKFHDILLDHILNHEEDFKIQSAMLCLNEASTCINSASLIYFANYKKGDWPEFEEVLHKFETLNNEFINAYSINHDLQWIDLEYNSFLESYKRCEKYFN